MMGLFTAPPPDVGIPPPPLPVSAPLHLALLAAQRVEDVLEEVPRRQRLQHRHATHLSLLQRPPVLHAGLPMNERTNPPMNQ